MYSAVFILLLSTWSWYIYIIIILLYVFLYNLCLTGIPRPPTWRTTVDQLNMLKFRVNMKTPSAKSRNTLQANMEKKQWKFFLAKIP